MVSFNSVPSNLRIPFVAVEFDQSKAAGGPALLSYKNLLIGQKLNSGSAAANSLVKVTSVDQVIAYAGRGSLLHRMALAYFANNKEQETWLGVLADNGAGVAAQGTITVAGPATAAGTIALYLGGERLTIGVNSGDLATAIATAIAAAINAAADLPITAAAVGAVVTLTFRHKGLAGNSYDMRDSFNDGEALPAGVGLTYVAMGVAIAGTTNPVLTTLIANMADMWFQNIAQPYTDATSLTAIETEMATRLGPMRAQDGVAFTSAVGTFSTLTTLGLTRNSPSSSILAQPSANPLTPPWEYAPAAMGVIAKAVAADPARPLQTLAVNRVVAPAETDLFDISERNLMLFDGVSTSRRAAGGVVQLERVISTYQTSPSGAADTSYLDVTTMFTLLYLRYSFRTRIRNKYPRHKLADDTARVSSGQAIMTPKLGRAEAIGWFRDMEKLGLVEDGDQFKQDLVVERNVSDPNRLDFLIPPNLINGLVVVAAVVQFRL